MKKQVADLFEKIQGESSGLGKLLSKIPGLDGYMERSRRREADQLLRETIAARLDESRLQLSGVQQEISGDIIKAIDHAEPLGRVDNRLMGLIGKIRDAPQGYAGFFDAVKVKEDDLARLYAFDENMLNHVDEIAAEVATLEEAAREDGDIGASIRQLAAAVKDANESFSGRNEVLAGIGNLDSEL
jgi:hypothetical protein